MHTEETTAGNHGLPMPKECGLIMNTCGGELFAPINCPFHGPIHLRHQKRGHLHMPLFEYTNVVDRKQIRAIYHRSPEMPFSYLFWNQ
jgi:hypothetical protein